VNYSNPTTKRVVNNSIIGVTTIFQIEENAKGQQRCTRRVTKKKDGTFSKTIYGRRCRIVDGDDGRIYVATLHAKFDLISIMQDNLKFRETIHDFDRGYARILALLNE
jgi:hypothetical protein